MAITARPLTCRVENLRRVSNPTARLTDVFLLFSDHFVEPGPFVSIAIERLKIEHKMACQALAEKNCDPLPPLPKSLFDESQPSADRLREAITFGRSLFPRKEVIGWFGRCSRKRSQIAVPIFNSSPRSFPGKA